MNTSQNTLTQSSMNPRYFATIIALLFLGYLVSLPQMLYADVWKCGTPLLLEDTPTIQNITYENGDNIFAAPAAPAQLGQVERLFIHIPEASIRATCVAVGKHCYIYVENTLLDMLPEAEAKSIVNTFDTNIYPKVHHWIGSELKPGLDRDNRITILFHDVGMNASGKDYGGYFSPNDLHPTHPHSNRRDIVYMDIFQYKERERHTFFSSLTHEFAHLINWYQNGGTNDQRWLEEGIASFTEWGVYGNIHTLFVNGYLDEPSMSLTTANNANTYYGAAFMLLLYLYENHGGISFIRQLAAEDLIGLQAIDVTLGQNKRFVDIFLNWGIANWFNNPKRGEQFNYQHLPNRKITARTPRINRYPTNSNFIQIDSWGIHYVLFENLPEIFDLTLFGNSNAHLYANIVYLTPDSNIPIIKHIPTAKNQDNPNTPNTYNIEIGNINGDGQILLIVTSEYQQMYKYIAKSGAGVDVQNIEETIISRWDSVPPLANLQPKFITYLPPSQTQPVHIERFGGTVLIPTNQSTKLEHKTQIHLSSNYHEIVIQENNAYAASDWGLEIFDLTPSPKRIGDISTPGNAYALATNQDYVYIADGKSGVHLIDVNQPTSPRFIKTIGGFQEALDVHLADGKLYALDILRGLLVYNHQDILNQKNPHPKTDFKTAGTPLNVSTDNAGNIYLSDNANGLYVMTPNPLGGFTVKGTVPVLALDFDVQGKFVLVISGDLQILNIGHPLAAEQVARLNTAGLASSVVFHDGLLYITDKQAGLYILNVNNLQSPQVISSIPTVGNAQDVALQYSEVDNASYAYIADGKGGIQTFDITKPEMPIWLSRYDASGIAHGLDLSNTDNNKTIAVANGTGGLKIVEMTDDYQGEVTQNIRSLSGEYGALCVKIHNQHAYVGTDKGLDIIDLQTGIPIRHITTSDPIWEIAIVDSYAYLCAKSLNVVNITNPPQSRIVSRREFSGSAYKIALNSTHAYVASLEDGIHILDITHPASPQPISHFPTDGIVTNVCLDGNVVYILDSHQGILKMDGTDPQKLALLTKYVETQLPIDAVIHGDYIYLLDKNSLQIIDAHTMQRRTRYTQLQSPTDLVMNESTLYITDLYQLNIFQVDTNQFNLAVEDEQYSELDDLPLSIRSTPNQLFQNYPNPFNPETWIPFSLAKATEVTLFIYDINGRIVKQQALGYHQSGVHTTYWAGRNITGEQVASGIYYYTLSTGDYSATMRMVINR